ncbi:arsenate reductase (glutaredoxin) [Oceanihabitans sediminis]|uniref:Arsenate reductase (Glutaredoxin) n=1 Tax=Oceanihabitans sediminis TaxID=1812012 RepID=A0A368P8N3_9FLAO|nr:arsenate reductase (glutaredoxin) [Oceanihabitans sediminis]MDX1277531.1 arsenate reductase (glutaredoxin) [Oceanihabitans sediminis]RBP32883.1 arsenate reductase [Oceanihabitans sediminis]RCU57591.1 arsenate reductase (glutaredoxin) [Oceanihabitans sediminis]
MIHIYHNNRCSKSRSALEVLKNSGEEFEVINYLETNPDKEELEKLIKLLNIKPIELVRKNEAIWKENYKGKTLTDLEVIEAMAQHPKLIERPIVVKDNKAVIGRPTELVIDLLK